MKLVCQRCRGRGVIETSCSMCHDSTWDHECDDTSEPCPECHGAKVDELHTLDGYQRAAMRSGAASRGDGALSLAGMGLAGEAGEVCDLLKKVVHHGRPLDDAMRAKLIEECGDVLWYLAFAADTLGVSLTDMAEANVAKLARRYPNGFNSADSIARRDEATAQKGGA